MRMTLTERRQQLFENIARLRRAERIAPGNKDIRAVRSDLEKELGETVSRSLAARLLGLSHTALSRWIERGDLPLVITPQGRRAVPVSALVDLYEAVRRERESGRRRRHTLEPVFVQGRERALRMDPRRLVSDQVPRVDSAGALTDSDPHRVAELRSLAYHRALAPRLRKSMINDAQHLLGQWRDSGTIDPHYAERWEAILGRPLPEIKRAISDDTPLAQDLRQNSPLAGLLSEAERRRIISEIR
jgi:hypothetical protein